MSSSSSSSSLFHSPAVNNSEGLASDRTTNTRRIETAINDPNKKYECVVALHPLVPDRYITTVEDVDVGGQSTARETRSPRDRVQKM